MPDANAAPAAADAAANSGHKLTLPYFNGEMVSTGTVHKFLELLESYRVMVGYSEANKVKLLPTALTGRALIWFDNEAAESIPEIKEDWAVFEREFKAHYGATMTVRATLSARRNVIQSKNETVNDFYERCRHIVRMTYTPFVSTEEDDVKNHDLYKRALKQLRAHVNKCDTLNIFVQGLIPEIKRLIIHRSFKNAMEVKDHAINAELALRNEGHLKDPNLVDVNSYTDPKTGVTTFGSTPSQGRSANYMDINTFPEEDEVALNAVAGRGRGRGAPRGRGRGRGTGQRQRPQCKHCKQMGHEEQTCWAKYPHLKPVRSASAASAQQASSNRVANAMTLGYVDASDHLYTDFQY